MGKQKIEIEVDVPDGWEATGEYRAPKAGETAKDAHCPGAGHHQWECDGIIKRIILRPVKSPTEAWLEHHPWLPEGCYCYCNGGTWFVGNVPPREAGAATYYTPSHGHSVAASALAGLFGKTFTPPPGYYCIQVTRT